MNLATTTKKPTLPRGYRQLLQILDRIEQNGWSPVERSIGTYAAKIQTGTIAMDALREILGTSVTAFESSPGRTKEDVLSLLRKAVQA